MDCCSASLAWMAERWEACEAAWASYWARELSRLARLSFIWAVRLRVASIISVS